MPEGSYFRNPSSHLHRPSQLYNPHRWIENSTTLVTLNIDNLTSRSSLVHSRAESNNSYYNIQYHNNITGLNLQNTFLKIYPLRKNASHIIYIIITMNHMKYARNMPRMICVPTPHEVIILQEWLNLLHTLNKNKES